jgi:hypothetical protein
MKQKTTLICSHYFVGIGTSTFLLLYLQFCRNPLQGNLELRFSMAILSTILITAGLMIQKIYIKIDKTPTLPTSQPDQPPQQKTIQHMGNPTKTALNISHNIER